MNLIDLLAYYYDEEKAEQYLWKWNPKNLYYTVKNVDQ